MKLQGKILAMFMMLFVSISAMAQVTTSSMSGQVKDDVGAVVGATVIARHLPTGTKYGAATNTEGRFHINNMRVGGPYRVEVSYIGYKTQSHDNITLKLGETYILNVKMSDNVELLSEVLVTAKATKFSTEKTGATTNIDNKQLVNMPTISRSLNDITKMSPYASGMSIAAGDGRSTNFTIDGANFNNNFGLSSALPGGGTPISLDAIEELQIVVAPFDVRQTNFIGGGVNAITKSGTNNFKGTAYTYFNNQNMRGNKIAGVDLGDRPDESKANYGMTFGGPIVKDRLFFFINGEYEKRPRQVVTWRPSIDGKADDSKHLSRTKISDMDLVKEHLKTVYGYDPGSYTDFPGDETNFKLLGRLDWNITDNHRLNFRYNYTKNQAWRPTNGNSTDAGYRNRSMDRISQYGMVFSNSLFSMDNIVSTISSELSSRFGNNASNQFLVTYSKIKDMRGSNSAPFPFIDILVGRNEAGDPIVEPYISAGYELFSWNNGVNNNTFTLTDNFTYYRGDHKITAGLSYEYQLANNAYMRGGTGYYRYASVEDFLNQAAPIDINVTYGYGGQKNPAAEVAFHQTGAYLQDEWNVSSNFKVTLGLRADYLKYVDNLVRNNAIYALDYDGKKIDTGVWPKARVQLSPRFGFSWDVMGDQSLKVRGGTGIFTGRLPLVFFTNMPTNSGMVQGSGAFTTSFKNGKVTKAHPGLAEFAGKMITDPIEMAKKMGLPSDITPESGALPRDINGVDPEFRMPQVWKSSLALDYRIPVAFPFKVSVEGIFTKTINGVMLANYDIKQPDDTWERFNGPDNRYIYPNNATINKKNAYMLTNNSEGWGMIGNITATAEPLPNLDLMLAYTYTDSREISGMPGSNARSAYDGLLSIDGPHLPILQRSQYVVPHKLIGSLSYKFNITDYLTPNISIFYIGTPASTHSFTYANDMNGDGIAADLIYIPSKKGEVKFVSQADEDAFFSYLEQDPYLSAHKGQYAGANAVNAPWLHRFDLKFTQDINVKIGKTVNKLQFSFDILNFGNLLNDKWGVPKDNMSPSNNGAILKYVRTEADKTPVFSFEKNKATKEYITKTFDYAYSRYNTWMLQIGVRYIFN